MGLPEKASIYKSKEERQRNKPNKMPAPNKVLEKDMEGYRAKIERKFAESHLNQSYQMPRVYPTPLNVNYSEGATFISPETAMMIAKFIPKSNELDSKIEGLDFDPASTSILESL